MNRTNSDLRDTRYQSPAQADAALQAQLIGAQPAMPQSPAIQTPAGARRGKLRMHSRPALIQPAEAEADAMEQAPAHKPSAVFSASRLIGQQPYFERAIGGVLLGLSIAGTIALFNGKWTQPTLGAFAAGLFVQTLLTYVEWMYRSRRTGWQYLAALLIDAGLSVLGYMPIVADPLLALFKSIGIADASGRIGATLFIIAAAGLLAYVPERILVQD